MTYWLQTWPWPLIIWAVDHAQRLELIAEIEETRQMTLGIVEMSKALRARMTREDNPPE